MEQILSSVNENSSGLDRDARVVVHSPSLKCIPDKYNELENILQVLLLGKATKGKFKDTFQKNVVQNLDAVLESPGVKDVLPVLLDKPAVIVGAGPSLDRSLGALRLCHDHAWIFAMDTALPALKEAGVNPDFIVSVDPQDEIYKSFKACPDLSIPLIFIPNSNSKVVNEYRGPKIVAVQKGNSVTECVEGQLEHKGFTCSGGSVSCIALDLAVSYGADPVILVGQDFGFPGGKAFSSGSVRNQQWSKHTNRFDTLEMKHRTSISARKLVEAEDVYGGRVLTHQNLYSYLREIENIINRNPATMFYNLLSSGCRIKGAQEIFFTEEVTSFFSGQIDKKINIKETSCDPETKADIMEKLAVGINA